MKTQHTPGQWHVKHDWGTSVCNSVGQCVADTDANVHIDDQTKAANAALIAQAPDLLAQVHSLQAALSDACLIIDSLKVKLDASTKAYALLASHRDRLAEALDALVNLPEIRAEDMQAARKALGGAQ